MPIIIDNANPLPVSVQENPLPVSISPNPLPVVIEASTNALPVVIQGNANPLSVSLSPVPLPVTLEKQKAYTIGLRQKWEYVTVSYPSQPGEPTYNALGLQGWEMVGFAQIIPVLGGIQGQAIFKRPLLTSPE